MNISFRTGIDTFLTLETVPFYLRRSIFRKSNVRRTFLCTCLTSFDAVFPVSVKCEKRKDRKQGKHSSHRTEKLCYLKYIVLALISILCFAGIYGKGKGTSPWDVFSMLHAGNFKIAEINVISAEKEDGAYLSMAKDMIPKIIDAQSADIDTISGATFSSTGIKNASEQALEKAVK